MTNDQAKRTVMVGFRLPVELYARIKDDADQAGQKLVVWFTRAAMEKLSQNKQEEK